MTSEYLVGKETRGAENSAQKTDGPNRTRIEGTVKRTTGN